MRKELLKHCACYNFLRALGCALLTTLALCLFQPAVVFANSYENSETGYQVLIADEADLLSASNEATLMEEMKAITEHGNVAFVSINDNPSYSTEAYAENFCADTFGSESATVFIIDMDNRYLWIYSQGKLYDTITNDYAQTITDNVYTYASDQDYYTCASIAFDQMNTLLEGKWIAQPMKYIGNAFLAVALALLINYFVVMVVSRSRKASTSQLMNGIYTKVDINNARANFTHQTKKYSPQSSGSSGGSGRSGGGGGGGGGGGHRF